jgi:hypothetical protein
MRFAVVFAMLTICFLCVGCSENQTQRTGRDAQAHESVPKLRHVVLFKFKDTSSPEEVQRVVDAFRALPDKIDLIQDFEWGVNNSPEPFSHGLTHAFLLTFASEADRDAYLPHPAHKEFGEIAGPHLDKITVVDYWANN